MASSSEAAEGLEAAIAAIPRIAEVIAAIPVEDRARAFGMARRLYLQTAHDLGGGEAAARNLVSTVMRHLLLQVAERDAAKQKMLKALLQELSRAEAASDTNVIWNLGQEMDVGSWHPN
jgi:hypothetical protein